MEHQEHRAAVRRLEEPAEAAFRLRRRRTNQRVRQPADQPPVELNQPDSSAFASLAEAGQTSWNIGLEASIPIGFRNAHVQVRNLRAAAGPSPGRPRRRSSTSRTKFAEAFQSARSLLRGRPDRPSTAASRPPIACRPTKPNTTFKAPRPIRCLRAQQSLNQAELSYYQAISQYNQAITNFYYRTGTILEESNVTVAEACGARTPTRTRCAKRGHAATEFPTRSRIPSPPEFVVPPGQPTTSLPNVPASLLPFWPGSTAPQNVAPTAPAPGPSVSPPNSPGPSTTPAPKSIPTPVPEPSHSASASPQELSSLWPQSAFGPGPNELPASGSCALGFDRAGLLLAGLGQRSRGPRGRLQEPNRRGCRSSGSLRNTGADVDLCRAGEPDAGGRLEYAAGQSSRSAARRDAERRDSAGCSDGFRQLRDARQPGSRQVASTTGRLSSRDEPVAARKARPGRARWAGTAACARIHSARRQSPG